MTIGKAFTIFSCVLFFWTFWYVSCMGVYTGPISPSSDRRPHCRYLTARGFMYELQEVAIPARSTSTYWCPATYIFPRGR